jgi:glycosyltransferase involved in cell wall biosynthesis
MSQDSPQLSIGFPVYNGERYLQCALDCVRAQTFEDHELIISDNGSTDRTEEICRNYAAADSRVRYIRHERNKGAAFNYNVVFEEARAPFFKWISDDDTMTPDMVARCMETLQANPKAIIAYPLARHIDALGEPLSNGANSPLKHFNWDVSAPRRFRQMVDAFRVDGGASAPMFWYGVIRSEALRHTRMMGTYFASDLVLLAELALLGKFVEVPERLLAIRLHPGSSSWPESWSPESIHDHLESKKNSRTSLSLKMRRFYVEYANAVIRAPIPGPDKVGLLAYCASLPLAKVRDKAFGGRNGA